MARTDIEVPAEDQRGWPEPWLASRGLSGDDLLTHGATHTVAELIAAASKGPLTARLQGHCSGYVGPVEFDGAYFGIRTFTDSSGSVKVLQPVSLEVIGAGDSMVEVEVECPGPIGPPHEPPDTPSWRKQWPSPLPTTRARPSTRWSIACSATSKTPHGFDV